MQVTGEVECRQSGAIPCALNHCDTVFFLKFKLHTAIRPFLLGFSPLAYTVASSRDCEGWQRESLGIGMKKQLPLAKGIKGIPVSSRRWEAASSEADSFG